MTQPTVTIIVSPRERFSYTGPSLESIYDNTRYPFTLIYVDGNSPSHIANYLTAQAELRDFVHLRTEHYLAPNQARNLGLSRRDACDYVVFIDNDVLVTPGWLTQLVECAETTGAAIVSPLTCIGEPGNERVHLAGGEARIEETVNGKLHRRVHEKHYFVNRSLDEVKDFRRTQCEFAEFHCMLVRSSLLEQMGSLDEGHLSTREHIDFCLSVREAGGSVWVEPESVVTYVPGPPFEWSDLAYFMLRWSDEWELASLEHFKRKWDLSEDKYFTKRYDRLGQRRHLAFIRPLVKSLSQGEYDSELEALLVGMEREVNRYLSARNKRQVALPIGSSRE